MRRLTFVAGWIAALLPPSLLVGIAATDILGMLIVALFLAHAIGTRDGGWLKRPWIVIAFLLWALLVARGHLSEHPDLARSRSLGWIRFPLLAAALGTWLLPEPKLRRRFARAWTATVLFLLGDAAVQWFAGVDLFGRLPVPLDNRGNVRLTGPFADPKVGIVLSWLVFPAIGIAAARVGAVAAWLLWLAALAVIFASGERMALLNVVLGGALFWFLVPSARRVGLVFAAIGLLGLGALAVVKPTALDRQVRSTIEAASHLGSSAYGQIWESGWRMFEQHPVLGVGTRQFRELCPRAEYGDPAASSVRCNIHPHHFWLEWLVETGIVGTALFVLLLVTFARERSASAADPAERAGSQVALLLRLWPLSTAASFFVAWSALPFWLALGWALAVAKEKRRC